MNATIPHLPFSRRTGRNSVAAIFLAALFSLGLASMAFGQETQARRAGGSPVNREGMGQPWAAGR